VKFCTVNIYITNIHKLLTLLFTMILKYCWNTFKVDSKKEEEIRIAIISFEKKIYYAHKIENFKNKQQ